MVRATDLGYLLTAKNLGASLRRVRELAAREQHGAECTLERLLAEIGGEDLDVRLSVRHGAPSTVILDELRRVRPALVVLGTHGGSGIQRVILGSVAETVVRRATGDVLIARSDAPGTQRQGRRMPGRGDGDGPRSGPIVMH